MKQSRIKKMNARNWVKVLSGVNPEKLPVLYLAIKETIK